MWTDEVWRLVRLVTLGDVEICHVDGFFLSSQSITHRKRLSYGMTHGFETV